MLHRTKRLDLERRLQYVGLADTLVYDTTLNTVFLQDGVTPGGISVSTPVSLEGPSELQVGIPNEFTILDYDAYADYSVEVDQGEVSLEGSSVIVNVDVAGGSVNLIVRRNGVGRYLELTVERNLGPGPTELIGGDMSTGFFGEVNPEELITYDGLASQIGLTGGTSQFNAESKWLKFALDESILFVMMKPGRHTVSWDQIHARNAVYGDLEVDIGDHRFKCRLLKGASTDPSDAATTFNPVGTHLSEWNRLMYPIHSGDHTDDRNPITPEMGTWAQYSDADLLVYNQYGNGSYSWCQETRAGYAGHRIARGSNGVSFLNSITSPNSLTGWRAVLELV